jgi:hypothetical protein
VGGHHGEGIFQSQFLDVGLHRWVWMMGMLALEHLDQGLSVYEVPLFVLDDFFERIDVDGIFEKRPQCLDFIYVRFVPSGELRDSFIG